MKKTVMRMCVITREKLPKNELIRIVKNKEGIVTVDSTGKQNGRGAYLKKDINIIKKAQQSKVLNKILDTEIDNEIYEKLLETIGGGQYDEC